MVLAGTFGRGAAVSVRARESRDDNSLSDGEAPSEVCPLLSRHGKWAHRLLLTLQSGASGGEVGADLPQHWVHL